MFKDKVQFLKTKSTGTKLKTDRKNYMGILYVVATPIGNLEDITLRALRILAEVDFILCEDSRRTKKLLDHYKIFKKLVSFHHHTNQKKIDWILGQLLKGKTLALVSDAGTPGISDPGARLVALAHKEKIKVSPISGPSSISAALSCSGFSGNSFLFCGFPPKKKKRKSFFRSLKKEKRIIVIFESPYRILKTLRDFLEMVGDREVVVFRELTKKFEETIYGRISEVIFKIKPKGEFVIVVNNE